MDDSQLKTEAPGGTAPSPGELDRWGPFRLVQRVGHGSFGEVYRAFDPLLKRHVALKLLLPRGLDREAEARSLLNEARAMAKVRHPNVVPIFGVDQHDGRVGLWSDFVHGRTLRDLLAAQGPFGPREAALVGIDVCRAAGAVHAAGLVHRDIKPGNVMREEGGRILLMDFGLSHKGGADTGVSGTPAYMAPELMEGQPATVASDVYAIGVLLFNLLTGRHPVEGSDTERLRSAHRSGSRRSLLDVRPDLPEALVHVVETAIDPDPRKRFGSVGLLASALSGAIGLSAGTTAAVTPPRPVFPRAVMIASVASLAAVAAAAAALALALRWNRPAPLPSAPPPVPAGREEYQKAQELLAHHYRPGALANAIPLLERVVARDPKFAPAWADLARACFLQFTQLRDVAYIERTRAAALRAIAVAPDQASAHATLGALYAWTAQNDLATQEIEEALRLDRLNAPAYGARAELYKRQGRQELVEPSLRKAVELAPFDWSLIQQLGEHYLDEGKWALAGEQYRRAAELMPDNPRPHNNLGLVYQGLGKLEESEAAFRKAIDLEPTALRYRNLGMVLAEAGEYPEAERMLERSIEMRPDSHRAWGLLASVYLDRKADPKKVSETFDKAIALSAGLLKETPRDEHLLADVGWYHAALGRAKEAVPLLAQAAALTPDSPQVLYRVAVGYEALGRRDEALRFLARARATGYPAAIIDRNPQLTALRADPRYAETPAGDR